MKKIYCSVTTLKDWREKFQEISDLGLTEVAIFLTGLQSEQDKKDFYDLLKKSPIKYVPLVHLRSNTTPEEIKMFMEEYGCQTFNIHLESKHPLEYDLSEFKDFIFVENLLEGFEFPERLSEFAGICVDFSHLEALRLLNNVLYNKTRELFDGYKIGVAHLSAILPQKRWDDWDKSYRYDSHSYENLSEFDYLLDYKDILPDIMAIELNDSIKKQLEAKEYLEKLLKI